MQLYTFGSQWDANTRKRDFETDTAKIEACARKCAAVVTSQTCQRYSDQLFTLANDLEARHTLFAECRANITNVALANDPANIDVLKAGGASTVASIFTICGQKIYDRCLRPAGSGSTNQDLQAFCQMICSQHPDDRISLQLLGDNGSDKLLDQAQKSLVLGLVEKFWRHTELSTLVTVGHDLGQMLSCLPVNIENLDVTNTKQLPCGFAAQPLADLSMLVMSANALENDLQGWLICVGIMVNFG